MRLRTKPFDLVKLESVKSRPEKSELIRISLLYSSATAVGTKLAKAVVEMIAQSNKLSMLIQLRCLVFMVLLING